jgi:hypothetical protein
MSALYAYLIERVHPDIAPEDAAISGGTRPLPAGFTLRALAEELTREARFLHAYVGEGRLRCSLWPYRDGDARPLTPGCQAPPAGAVAFEYGNPA